MANIEIVEILQQVRTPLALSALALLVAAPILKTILEKKDKPNEDTKSIIRYLFITGLVFGVLAIFVYWQSIPEEIRVSGSVRDQQTGAALQFVDVHIPGCGGGQTKSNGDFEFTIPDSRAADEYVADIYLADYDPQRIILKGRYPKPISVTLKKSVVDYSNIIQLPNNILIGHHLGIPLVQANIVFANPFSKEIQISDIEMTITKPDGSNIPMSMDRMSVIPGQWAMPLPVWTLRKNVSDKITYIFFSGDNVLFINLQQKVANELNKLQNPVYHPDQNLSLISDETVQELKRFMLSQFIWIAGDWKITVSCKVNGMDSNCAAKFYVSEDMISKMKAIANYYPSAIGVIPGWSTWSSTIANPIATVDLKIIKQ
uniref:Uncharacterized protein n=1 Tax=Desulfovibrio sp. U5L TaxID=596152 RepID=I2PZ33_9BACT